MSQTQSATWFNMVGKKKGYSLIALFIIVQIILLRHSFGFDDENLTSLKNPKEKVAQPPASTSNIELVKQSPIIETEFVETDPKYSKFVFENRRIPQSMKSGETVLVISSVVNEEAYGKDRTFDDFFGSIIEQEFPKNSMSLAFLFGTADEYLKAQTYFKKYFKPLNTISDHDKSQATVLQKFVRRVTLINAPFIDDDFSVDRADRHLDNFQRLRRRTIARSRNFVLFNSLQDERYTLFIDSDIVKFESKEMLKIFIESKKDIIVPRVQKGGDLDYDKNSWVGERTKPNAEELAILDKNDWDHFTYVPRDVDANMKHLFQLYNEGRENEYKKQGKDKNSAESDQKIKLDPAYSVQIDSVGGAVLFSRSLIYRQGIAFPPTYIIGTTWDRLEGYDGIETEGLCYLAKPLGYKCWAMPNLVAQHDTG
ncbi:hypothetical protein CAAN1_01S03202 [[Candida] anglica]|uniref:Uncharacterized protein n=1 Tax=[Candida] anglica TaxID=148631 RepID=A0ABP0EJC0_9ASCO